MQFALYFLAIKIGLIAPNVPLEFNQHQPNQQLVSRVQPIPVYNPYVSILDEYRPPGLYMSNIERPSLVPQHYNSQKLINELRAGDSRVTQAAWLLITIWMLQQQSVGFQPVNHAPLPPHIESARNFLFGKPKPDQLSCRQLSRFDQQQQFQEAEYPSAVTVEEALKLPDVRTYEAAKKYAKMNLPERLSVNEQHYISGVMAAKKTPHAPEIGLNPVDYGMKAEHVTLIRGMGLYQYLQKGYPLPPSDFIEDYQNCVRDICLQSETAILDDKPYTHNRKIPISIYENQGMSKSGKSVAIVVFDDSPGKGDLITVKFSTPKLKKVMNMTKNG